MNHQEIKTWLESPGYPTAEVCFEQAPPSPPFTLWLDEIKTYTADGIVIMQVHNILLEVYSDFIDDALEGGYEALLMDKKLCYTKERGWVDNARLHVTVYKFHIIERMK